MRYTLYMNSARRPPPQKVVPHVTWCLVRGLLQSSLSLISRQVSLASVYANCIFSSIQSLRCCQPHWLPIPTGLLNVSIVLTLVLWCLCNSGFYHLDCNVVNSEPQCSLGRTWIHGRPDFTCTGGATFKWRHTLCSSDRYGSWNYIYRTVSYLAHRLRNYSPNG